MVSLVVLEVLVFMMVSFLVLVFYGCSRLLLDDVVCCMMFYFFSVCRW